MDNIQLFKKDEFNYGVSKTIDKEEFKKSLELVYDKYYKPSLETDGFRAGHVPFNIGVNNPKIADKLLEQVMGAQRQLFLEEVIAATEHIGSIYDVKDEETETEVVVALDTDDPIVLSFSVEFASYVEKVKYEDLSIDKSEIKTKKFTEKDINEIFSDYKKIKNPQNKATKTSFVEILFDDGENQERITFSLSQKIDEEDELKVKTHQDIYDLTIGKSVGHEFEYELTGKDLSKLPVKAKITDIYRVRELSDEEFLGYLKENENIDEENKEELTVEKVKDAFREHLSNAYQDRLEEEINALLFIKLRELTEGINYNQREIDNLKIQIESQINKSASEEGISVDAFIKKNFGSRELMEDYFDASQKARVLSAAIYRKIGESLNIQPNASQLRAFVKLFVYGVNDVESEKMSEQEQFQLNTQIDLILADPLSNRRIVESWKSMKAEDVIREKVQL